MILHTLTNWKPNCNSMPIELQNMYNEMDAIKHKIIEKIQIRQESNPVPDILYHYTDVFGLKGIAIDGELWCSDFRSTNDSTEGQLFKIFLENAVKQHSQSFFDDISFIFSPTNDYFTTTYKKRDLALYKIFIASFTKKQDKLLHWLHYGSSGSGYCLGIESHSLKSHNNETFADLILFPVIYDLNVIKQDIDFFLNNILDLYNRYNEIFKVNSHLSFCLICCIDELYIFANSIWSLQYKNECFSEEEEWRCLITIPRNRKFTPLIRVNNKNELMQYISLKPVVKTIMSGAKVNHKNLLNLWGENIYGKLKDVNFTHSNIPLR